MSARDDLHAELSYVVGKALAEEMIDAFAHDLAERIRAEGYRLYDQDSPPITYDMYRGMRRAAKLIDPEVSL